MRVWRRFIVSVSGMNLGLLLRIDPLYTSLIPVWKKQLGPGKRCSMDSPRDLCISTMAHLWHQRSFSHRARLMPRTASQRDIWEENPASAACVGTEGHILLAGTCAGFEVPARKPRSWEGTSPGSRVSPGLRRLCRVAAGLGHPRGLSSLG